MSNTVRIIGSEGIGIRPIPLCLDHAQKRLMTPPVWMGYPTTGMKCSECMKEASPAATYAHLTNDGYNVYIKNVARYLAPLLLDAEKTFLAEAMTTFWPQTFLWGLFYSEIPADKACDMLKHFLFEQEATQPLWNTLTEDF